MNLLFEKLFQLSISLRLLFTAEIQVRHGNWLEWVDDSQWLSILYSKRSAKNLMPADNLVETALESVNVQLANQTSSKRNIVRMGSWINLIKEPENLFSIRERQFLVSM